MKQQSCLLTSVFDFDQKLCRGFRKNDGGNANISDINLLDMLFIILAAVALNDQRLQDDYSCELELVC